jgi:hypothetical protein
VVAFQIAFRAEIHANDVFLFFKNYFWHQHIKTIQKVQPALNFCKKKNSKFDETQLQTQCQTVSKCIYKVCIINIDEVKITLLFFFYFILWFYLNMLAAFDYCNFNLIHRNHNVINKSSWDFLNLQKNITCTEGQPCRFITILYL